MDGDWQLRRIDSACNAYADPSGPAGNAYTDSDGASCDPDAGSAVYAYSGASVNTYPYTDNSRQRSQCGLYGLALEFKCQLQRRQSGDVWRILMDGQIFHQQ